MNYEPGAQWEGGDFSFVLCLYYSLAAFRRTFVVVGAVLANKSKL